MPNRILKKQITDEYGRVRTSYNIIKSYLRANGEKTFGEIKKHLAKNSIKYADNKGLDLALKSMLNRKEIGKHVVPGKPHPTYYYKKEEITEIASIADEFRRSVLFKIKEFPSLPRQNLESDEDYFIHNLIYLYGFYNLFIQLRSWKLTNKKKSHKQNSEMRSQWLRNTLPLGQESLLFEDGITELSGLKYYRNTKEFDQTVSRIYGNTKKQNKFNDIEKLLGKKYPEEMKFFDEIIKTLPDETINTKKWIKEMQQMKEWKKRIKRKNAKSKKPLKPNQCPICLYDGSYPARVGIVKGKIFEKGFTLEPGLEFQGRHCPQCGYWENLKNS